MTQHTYYAFSDGPGRKGYICYAFNRRQMKAAGMNMRLTWLRAEEDQQVEDIKLEFKIQGFEFSSFTNVLDFEY